MRCQTYDLVQYLAQNAYQLVVDKLAAFQTRVLQTLDLLLNNDLEGLCTDEDSRCKTL